MMTATCGLLRGQTTSFSQLGKYVDNQVLRQTIVFFVTQNKAYAFLISELSNEVKVYLANYDKISW